MIFLTYNEVGHPILIEEQKNLYKISCSFNNKVFMFLKIRYTFKMNKNGSIGLLQMVKSLSW